MKRNLFEKIPDELPEELSSLLTENENVKIERIVSDGHASPEGFWYDQEQNEWIMLMSGTAVLSIEENGALRRVELHPGDHLLLPAHQRHRVEATSQTEKTIWLAVYYSPPAALEDTEAHRA